MTTLSEPITEPIVLENYVGGEWRKSEGEYHEIIDPRPASGSLHTPLRRPTRRFCR